MIIERRFTQMVMIYYDLILINHNKSCELRVQMQVGSGDTAHGRLPWRVSPLATHAEPQPLIRINHDYLCPILWNENIFDHFRQSLRERN